MYSFKSHFLNTRHASRFVHFTVLAPLEIIKVLDEFVWAQSSYPNSCCLFRCIKNVIMGKQFAKFGLTSPLTFANSFINNKWSLCNLVHYIGSNIGMVGISYASMKLNTSRDQISTHYSIKTIFNTNVSFLWRDTSCEDQQRIFANWCSMIVLGETSIS